MAASNLDHLTANALHLLDVGAQVVSKATGVAPGGFFANLENWARQRQQDTEQLAGDVAGGEPKGTISNIARTLSGIAFNLPVAAGAAAVSGPVLGMAQLGALENADQGLGSMVEGTLEGGLQGGVLHVLGPGNRLVRFVGNAAVTYANAIAHGADKATAFENAATMGAVGAIPGNAPGGGLGFRGTAKNIPWNIVEGARGALPAFPSKLDPVKQQAIDYLGEEGVPLTAADVTGNRYLRAMEASTAHMPIGAEAAEEYRGAPRGQAMADLSGRLAEQVYPSPVTPHEAGGEMALALDKNIADLNKQEQEAYKGAWEGAGDPQYTRKVQVGTEQKPVLDSEGKPTGDTQPGPVYGYVNMPVDVRWMKQIARDQIDKFKYSLSRTERAQSNAYNVYRQILSGPDHISAEQGEEALKGLKTEVRGAASPNLRNVAQGQAAALIPRLQDDIESAVNETGPDAVEALRNGRDFHRQKMEIADVAKKLREEPVQAFGQLSMGRDAGVEYLNQIAKQAPDIMPRLGRAWLDDVFDQATREGGWQRAAGILRKWQTLGHQTKALMFPEPSLRIALDRFFLGGKLLGGEINPSGTALVRGAQEATQNPLKLLQGYIGSKLLFSPRGIKLLTGIAQDPPRTPAAIARVRAQAKEIAGAPNEPPQEPPTGGGPSPGGTPPGTIPPNARGQAAAPVATIDENAPPETDGPRIEREGTPDGGAPGALHRATEAESPAGTETRVLIPGTKKFLPANYEVRELADVQPSHSGQTFQPNPKYAYRNDRDYNNPNNRSKVLNGAMGGQFEPVYHITDNPDASNGPIVIDQDGNAIGGNGRAMILQRVYGANPAGAEAYRTLLQQKASQFGIDPRQVARMKQPVLVRRVDDSGLSGNWQRDAITDLNKVGTAALTPAEQAIADSRRVSPGTLDALAAKLDAGGSDATIASVLDGKNGAEILNKLIDDGVISPQDRAAYATGDNLTPAGKQRIEKLVLGRFFRDPAQLDSTPAAVRNKLQRMAAPLAKAESYPEWNLSPHIQEAIDLLESARSLGSNNIGDVVGQQTLFEGHKYSPESIALAKAMQRMNPNELTEAARQYAQDAKHAAAGAGLLGELPTAAESLTVAFGKAAKR
jgi:hypothetical protein